MKIGVTNLKGGVGKTTVSVNLAVCFAHLGYKTVLVDTDLNQNSFSWYSARDAAPEIMAVGATDPKGVVKVVQTLAIQYDIVLMDGTPSLSEMNTRVMLASDLLLVPTRPGAHDYRAMVEFIKRIEAVQEVKPDLKVYFLLNEYTEHYSMHRGIRRNLEEFAYPILQSTLKSRTAYGETNLSGKGAYEHTDVRAKDEIFILAKEIETISKELNLLS